MHIKVVYAYIHMWIHKCACIYLYTYHNIMHYTASEAQLNVTHSVQLNAVQRNKAKKTQFSFMNLWKILHCNLHTHILMYI